MNECRKSIPTLKLLQESPIPEHDLAIKPQNLGPLLMKSSQSNVNLRSPDSYLACSYLIATVLRNHFFHGSCVEPWEPWDSWTNLFRYFVEELKAGKFHLNSRQIKRLPRFNFWFRDEIIIRIEKKKLRTKTRHFNLLFSELDFRTLLCQNEKKIMELFTFCSRFILHRKVDWDWTQKK